MLSLLVCHPQTCLSIISRNNNIKKRILYLPFLLSPGKGAHLHGCTSCRNQSFWLLVSNLECIYKKKKEFDRNIKEQDLMDGEDMAGMSKVNV